MWKIGLSHLLSFAKFSVTFCPPSSKRWQELEAHTWWYFATNDATLNLNSGRYTIEETPLEPTQQPVLGNNMTYTLNDIGQLQVHVRGIEGEFCVFTSLNLPLIGENNHNRPNFFSYREPVLPSCKVNTSHDSVVEIPKSDFSGRPCFSAARSCETHIQFPCSLPLSAKRLRDTPFPFSVNTIENLIVYAP